MAAPVSRKLSNSFEGALAGGGDPATSPLYVFGPFLKLIVVAGVAHLTFGVSIWLVVLTVAMVSAMYRLVMTWVTDGSGGSGLSEEEFGGWAVKVNAGITFVEYTLTFLVSMAAMVTFIADRFPVLNHSVLGLFQIRTFVAIALSVLTGWLVNRGPKMAARVFGPATAGVLALLWAMILASVAHRYLLPNGVLRGVPLIPNFNLEAFKPQYLFAYTLNGYARILALMTGIEVFANLVAAYEGSAAEKSRKAFGSLMIIMGSTSLTMLIVGPAILALSDPTNTEVSVFTQTMDRLLPTPLPQFGTIVGIAVLLSASAASAQGLQNLALGLTNRHYVPPVIGQRNRFDVADKPVWIEVGIVVICFLFLGTSEETYLAIYAAGVFILLSMTGWAAAKRLVRQLRQDFVPGKVAMLAGTILAAVLTTGATAIIFEERFSEGAWTYFLFIPLLYAVFTYFRRRLGPPSELREELGRRVEAMWGVGVLPEQPLPLSLVPAIAANGAGVSFNPAQGDGRWRGEAAVVRRVMISLDGSEFAERALPMAKGLCRLADASLVLASVLPGPQPVRILPRAAGAGLPGQAEREAYLGRLTAQIRHEGLNVDYVLAVGPVAVAICDLVDATQGDVLVMSTHGRSGVTRWLLGSVPNAVIQIIDKPVLLLRPERLNISRPPRVKRVLVTLDGHPYSERVLPYAKALADAIAGEIILLTVPEVPAPEFYGPMSDAVKDLRREAEAKAWRYLNRVARRLREAGTNVRPLVTGSRPAQTIVEVSKAEDADLIMLTTHGRGGVERILMGSVADRVVHHADRPVFLVPVQEFRQQGSVQNVLEAANAKETFN